MASVSLEQEINPWEAQAARFDFAARKLNLEEGLWKLLRMPAREVIVHFPVKMDNGQIEMFTGFRVQHCYSRSAAVTFRFCCWLGEPRASSRIETLPQLI